MSNILQTINSATAVSGLPQPIIGASTCGIYLDSKSGNGTGYEVFVNDNLYTSSTSGYGIWTCGTNGLILEGNQLGGIAAGNTYNIFLRTFFADGTSQVSPVYSLTVPSTFPSCVAVTPIPVAPSKTLKKK